MRAYEKCVVRPCKPHIVVFVGDTSKLATSAKIPGIGNICPTECCIKVSVLRRIVRLFPFKDSIIYITNSSHLTLLLAVGCINYPPQREFHTIKSQSCPHRCTLLHITSSNTISGNSLYPYINARDALVTTHYCCCENIL